MRNVYVLPIVEGATEAKSIKRLLQRIWTEQLGVTHSTLCVLSPRDVNRSSLLHADGQSLAAELTDAIAQLSNHQDYDQDCRCFILILVDADEDCPRVQSERVLANCLATRPDADVAFVMAKREFENWFKAAASGYAGKVAWLPADLKTPVNPEEGSGDTWLSRQAQQLNRRKRYTKPADAEELVRHMDLAEAHKNSRSFQKLVKELYRRVPAPPPPNPPEAEQPTS